jgi:hypothetical protein
MKGGYITVGGVEEDDIRITGAGATTGRTKRWTSAASTAAVVVTELDIIGVDVVLTLV